MTENRTPILAVRDLVVRYGAIQALKGASLDVYPGEIVAVIGANGAGKSTMMNAIMGDVPRVSGEILLDGVALPAKSFQVVSAGVSLSPEGRKVFAPLTVLENLDMGAFPLSDKAEIERLKQSVFELFPRLLERKNQYAGTLSGGEQQMLAIGRALMARPRVLLLDEPSLGARTHNHQRNLQRAHRDQQKARHGDTDSRAEREEGPPALAPRLRHPDRHDHHGRQIRRPAPQSRNRGSLQAYLGGKKK